MEKNINLKNLKNLQNDLVKESTKKYSSPQTLQSDIGACAITPFKARLVTFCTNAVLLAV